MKQLARDQAGASHAAPWRVKRCANQFGIARTSVVDRSGDVVCEPARHSDGALIAQAPELRAALLALRNRAAQLRDHMAGLGDDYHAGLMQLAITDAESIIARTLEV